jgi:hypothetical protein
MKVSGEKQKGVKLNAPKDSGIYLAYRPQQTEKKH